MFVKRHWRERVCKMIYVVSYLLTLTATFGYILMLLILNADLTSFEAYRVGVTCAVIGGLGGCMYCLRGVYLNYCARDSWDDKWIIWYILRPITSIGSGAVSFLFLKAGLLVLESDVKTDASEFGFYALAFIAGLNVDKFIKKIEDIGEAVFGIEKSREATAKSETDR